MPLFVNQNGTVTKVAKVWVRQGDTVKEVKKIWTRQDTTISQVHSVSVNVEIPSGQDYYNHRTNLTTATYNAKLNDFLPSGVLASKSEVVNMTLASGTLVAGGPQGTYVTYRGGNGLPNTERAETAAPALYIGGTHRLEGAANHTASPTLGTDDKFPDGLILNITVDGGELLGGSGQRGQGYSGGLGTGYVSGGSGGPIILVDGVDNCTINFIHNSGTIRAGGGGGAGNGFGAMHGGCCAKFGGHGAGGWSNGTTVSNVGTGGADGGSHGTGSGAGGGSHGNDGGSIGSYPGGYGGVLVEFRNSYGGAINVSGSGTRSVKATAAFTSYSNGRGYTTTLPATRPA